MYNKTLNCVDILNQKRNATLLGVKFFIMKLTEPIQIIYQIKRYNTECTSVWF